MRAIHYPDPAMPPNLATTLHRLRTQAGATARPPAPSRPPAPATVAPAAVTVPRVADPALRRLLESRIRRDRAPPAPAADRALPGIELAPGLHYREHVPGLATAGEDTLAIATLGARGLESDHARERALFFDTETTGLAGGTGTRAFMIGAADWPDGRLRVRQLWITRLGAEAAMLEAFRDWLAPDTLLVSYNGRCYDAPLLRTRYRLARLPPALDELAHLDLLHAVRRRWRGAWENCRLATVERRLLGIAREDDLPGSEAPRVFREVLAGGPTTDLRRVIAHNHQDVVTLALLLDRMLAAAPGGVPGASVA